MPIPAYVGGSAFGLKMGVILPGSNLIELILERIADVDRDGLLDDNDVLCVTESLVARAQNNYVTTEEAAAAIQTRLSLGPGKTVGVLFPIVSRNRFSLILESIARAVPGGEVVVQLSYPRDEVGNSIMTEEQAEEITARQGDCINSDEAGHGFVHPITGVDYVRLYKDTIAAAGARATVLLCNDPLRILESRPDAVIAADIHTRDRHAGKLRERLENTCTLQELCNRDDGSGRAWSEFGLLGSNLSSRGRLKLAPRRADAFAAEVQSAIRSAVGKTLEIIVNGDGAYKDPTSRIYELADPQPALGATPGVKGACREGVKYKYLVDLHHGEGKTPEQIEDVLRREMAGKKEQSDDCCEGTTPRRMEDLLASLADLVSGSADAGTPMVLIKGIYD